MNKRYKSERNERNVGCSNVWYLGNDTLESYLSKVAVESDLRKKTCKNGTCSNRESLFRKKKNCERFHDTHARCLSKVTFDSYFRKKTF